MVTAVSEILIAEHLITWVLKRELSTSEDMVKIFKMTSPLGRFRLGL